MATKRDRIAVNLYCIVAEACRRAEQGDKQWRRDPNHFLIDYATKIMKYLHSQGVVIKVSHNVTNDNSNKPITFYVVEPLVKDEP